MTSRLVAPGVPRELLDELLTDDSPSQTPDSSSRASAQLTPVNAWSPPSAYGGPPTSSKTKPSQTSKSRSTPTGSLVSAENFLQFTQLPFQPADAPQRVSAASRFRLDRKLRYTVAGRTPPCVGAVAVAETPSTLRCVAFTPDASAFLVATDDGTCLWSAPPPQSTSTMEPEHRLWNELFFGAPSQPLSQMYQMPGLVQIAQQPPAAPSFTGLPVGTAPASGFGASFRPLNAKGVLAAAFAPDAPLVVTVGMHGQVTLTASDSLANLVSYSGHASRVPVWAVDWSPAGTYFATGAGDGCARLWRTDIVAPLRVFDGSLAGGGVGVGVGGRHVQNLSWHPNSQVLATASETEVVLWDVLGAAPIQRIRRSNTNDLSFSPSGNLLAIASDQGLEVWDVLEGKVLMSDEAEVVMNVAWSWPTSPPAQDAKGAGCLVTVGGEGRLKLYEKLGQNSAICELPLERNIRPFKAAFTWKNFLVVAGADASENLSI